MTTIPEKNNSRANEHREIWDNKPVLREIYSHLYKKIVSTCAHGTVVEVGGGSGNLKNFHPDVVSFDIVPAPWLDFVADAQSLPFSDDSVGNLVMFDVLHHIEYPIRFLAEAVRVLRPGGRIIMVEPAMTLFSWPFYRYIHEEPVVMSIDPLQDGVPDPNKDPFIGNQAIPTLLATRYARKLNEQFPALKIVHKEWLSLFSYPLSGGFKRWSLITPGLARVLLRLEDTISPVLGRAMGFRLFFVLEKTTEALTSCSHTQHRL